MQKPFGGRESNSFNDALHSISKVGRIGCFLFLIPFAIVHFDKILFYIRRSKTLVLFILWIIASIAWTHDITRSVNATLQYLLIFIFIIVATKYESSKLLTWIQISYAITVVLSLFFCVFMPHYGLTLGDTSQEIAHAGEWRGIFSHKNMLGQFVSQAAFFFYFGMLSSVRKFFIFLPLFLASITLLVNSNSATSLITVLFCFIIISLLKFFQYNPRQIKTFFFSALPLLIATIAALALNFNYVMSLFGRNATLTGRTPIWNLCLQILTEGPWLKGFGIAGFWPEIEDPSTYSNYPGYSIWQTLGFTPVHAHNGFLEVALELGAIGLFLLLVVLIRNIYRTNQVIITDSDLSWDDKWILVWIYSFLILNISECVFLNSDSATIIFLYMNFFIIKYRSTHPTMT